MVAMRGLVKKGKQREGNGNKQVNTIEVESEKKIVSKRCNVLGITAKRMLIIVVFCSSVSYPFSRSTIA